MSIKSLAIVTGVLALAASACGAAESSVVNAGAPVIEPQTQRFIDAVASAGGPPIYKLAVADARKLLDGAQSSSAVPLLAVDTQDATAPGGPRGPVSIHIVRPKDSAEVLPVIMYFHGGGWVLGNQNTHDRLVRELAHGANAAVVFVNYSPSPEARFPVGIEEAYAATKFIAENGSQLKVDGSRLAVAGDSVGGNMAAVVALLAKERSGPKIRHQTLFYPVTDANFDNGSYREFQRGPWLTKPAMEWFFDAYTPNVADRAKPTVSPLKASNEQLTGLPPALVITAENDVLRDEGEAYARRLIQAGVAVKSARYLGTIHDFVMLNALADTPAAKSAVALATTELRSALAR